MNVHLQQAMGALKEGKPGEAQVLLARVIKEEPENEHAWFLLSSLVASKEQKITFLRKVLTLNPEHSGARQQLARLLERSPETPAPKPAGKVATTPQTPQPTEPEWTEPSPEEEMAGEEPLDFLSQAQGDTVPSWLEGEEDFIGDDETVLAPMEERPEEAVEELPDWLQDKPAGEWQDDDKATTEPSAPADEDEPAVTAPESAESQEPAKKAPRQQPEVPYTLLFYTLVALAAIVGLTLCYLITITVIAG